jgi:hypothetical protein
MNILFNWISGIMVSVLAIFSYIMVRTNFLSTRWWFSLCTRPTSFVGFL